MATTITDTNVNTAAAAVPAPYGPLVRVTPVATLATPNSDQVIEFTTAFPGVRVLMTYDELTNATIRLRILQQAHGIQAAGLELRGLIDGWKTMMDGFGPTITYPEYRQIYRKIRDEFGRLRNST